MRSDFDYKYIGNKAGAPIDYGFVKGGSNAVFIKAGLDGSMYGYESEPPISQRLMGFVRSLPFKCIT